jgi:ornithine carbamoyltransferase
MTRFGMHVRLAHPDGYDLMPESVTNAKKYAAASGGSFTQTGDMDEAFTGADIVYPKSWGPYDLMLERVEANRGRDQDEMQRIEDAVLERNSRYRDWICDERRMGLTADKKANYLHCLPADIGAEVSSDVMERNRLDLARQANKKVYVIMSLLAAAKCRDLKDRLFACAKGNDA